jgi:hypothetical protein
MKSKHNTCFIVTSVTICSWFALMAVPLALGEVEMPFPALPDTKLTSIATLKVAPDGTPVVFYNPEHCSKVGENICLFYRAHEWGHIALQHVQRRVPLDMSEPEADCWAAQHIPKEAVVAAWAAFASGILQSPPQHGSSAKRAERLLGCADSRQ